jgi:hypothetical protein
MQNLPFAAQQEQVNKFLQANRVLGAQMDSMQGTTRVIYDTQSFNGITSYDFFSQVTGKSNTTLFNQATTNINDNRFEPGEGMVVKEIGLYNGDSTAAPATPFEIWRTIQQLGLINLYIGNQRVIKDLPLFTFSQFSSINKINDIITRTSENKNRRYLGVRLFTNIVIPPQVQFYLNLTLPIAPSAEADASAGALRVYLKGYGKLFNPRNNY